MKKKFLKLLIKIKRSKIFRSLFLCFILCSFIVPLFSFNSFAATSYTIRADTYVIDIYEYESELMNQEVSCSFRFTSGNFTFNSLKFIFDEDGYFYIYFDDRLVYDPGNGTSQAPNFVDNNQYLYIFVSDEQTVDASNNWIYAFEDLFNRFDAFDDHLFEGAKWYGLSSGYNEGYDEGFSNGEEQGYAYGYRDGYLEGINVDASENFGQNLIGDTLAAPFQALNSFVLFTSPSGVDVSLGFIFGGVIALLLFIAFLKMFAGG